MAEAVITTAPCRANKAGPAADNSVYSPRLDRVTAACQSVNDPSLPRGGRRYYFFHPDSQLPTLIVAKDDRGREVEYYFHDRLLSNVKLDDDDFDPDRLWSKAKAK